MYDILDLIKPKRLFDDKRAILSKDFIALEFSNTIIYKPCELSFPLSEIYIKDLYSNNFDAATSLDKFDFVLPELLYTEIPINATDTTFLSSVSAAGEDLFVCSEFVIGQQGIDIKVLGLVFYLSCLMLKPIGIKDNATFFVEYHVFYYLFQMFKNLSGKKVDYLLFSLNKGKLYLTNKNRDFYIVCTDLNAFSKRVFSSAKKVYSDAKFKHKEQVIRKDWVQEKDSFIKHLSRPLDDVIDIEDSDNMIALRNGFYSLFINKGKK